MNPDSIFANDLQKTIEELQRQYGLEVKVPKVFMTVQDLLDHISNDTNPNEKEVTMIQRKKYAGVINMSQLSQNARYDQMIAQTGMKVLHPDEQTAIREAERLAQANPGQEFGVFTLTAVSAVQKTVTTRV